MKFRKKSIEVEAVQWWKNGDHPADDCVNIIASGGLDLPAGTPFQSEGKIVRYFRRPDVSGEAPCGHCGIRMNDHGWIDTLEGGHIVCPGDWIVTGVKGEVYPCKPDIFIATYEPVQEM